MGSEMCIRDRFGMELWGGGASGQRNGDAGGGGNYKRVEFIGSILPDSATVAIGAGGLAPTTGSGIGQGGDSYFFLNDLSAHGAANRNPDGDGADFDKGGRGSTNRGGGGGSAGPLGVDGDEPVSNTVPGEGGVAFSPRSGNGGRGATNASVNQPGVPGQPGGIPGGGGGSGGFLSRGGSGARGRVVVTTYFT